MADIKTCIGNKALFGLTAGARSKNISVENGEGKAHVQVLQSNHGQQWNGITQLLLHYSMEKSNWPEIRT